MTIEAHVGEGGVCDDDCPHSMHTPKPLTTAGGLPVIGWGPLPMPVADTPCFHCNGHGWFTETVEGSNGRDEDVDYRCGACNGSGVET